MIQTGALLLDWGIDPDPSGIAFGAAAGPAEALHAGVVAHHARLGGWVVEVVADARTSVRGLVECPEVVALETVRGRGHAPLARVVALYKR